MLYLSHGFHPTFCSQRVSYFTVYGFFYYMLRHSETCNSIYPVTFPNIHRKSHFPKKKHCRSSSIADKRQRNACIGDCIGHHCNIQNNLKSQMPHNPATDKSSGQIFCMHGSHTQPPQKHCKQKNQKDSSGCSHFLTYNRKIISFCASGTNPSFCRLFPNPLPNIPPLPIAYNPWIV